jgi:hypothetical protein
MADVSESGVIDNIELQEASTGYTPFVVGDVLVAKITPCFENGKGAHVRGLPTRCGQGSTEFHVLRPRSATSDRYLYHLTRTSLFRLQGEGLMYGSAGQRRVPTEFFGRYAVRMPPLEEQRRIAEILDTIDETIQATERVIAKRKRIRAGLATSLLSGGPATGDWELKAAPSPRTLTSTSTSWDMSSDRLCEVVVQVTTKARGLKPSGSCYVGLEHIESGARTLIATAPSSFSQGTNGVFQEGDVLFGKLRPNLRKAVQVGFGGYCSTDLLVLRPRKSVDSRYAGHVATSESVFRHAERNSIGTRMPRTSWYAVAQAPVWLPPLEEQRRIAEILDTVDETIRANERKRDKLRQLRSGLAADLLSGRVRTVAA